MFYGAIFLDEAITAAAIVGLVLILGGVAIASRPKREPAGACASACARLIASRRVDLTLSPAEEEFRDTLRAWIADNHPGREPDGDEESFAFRREWQRKLNDRGWAGLTWPSEYGGAGATQIEQAIFFEEIARARAPQMANVLGLTMGGPTVIAHGTDDQKARFLVADPERRRDVVPGLQRARVGLRPRLPEDPRGAQGRRVHRHRPEGVDDVRAPVQVVHAARAHERRRAQAPRARPTS